MKVIDLADAMMNLVNAGHGDLVVFKSEDDEGNGFTHVNEVVITTAEEIEREDLAIEEPRPYDEDHVVIW